MSSKAIPKRLKPQGPHVPLDPKREKFCLAIVNGMSLKKAHSFAGFTGGSQQAAWQLRHSPPVDERVRWMLNERVVRESRTFARRQKSRGDLLARALQKLDDIMSTDIREVIDWKREPVLNADGEVVSIAETMRLKDASALSPKASAAIRSVFTKSGALRVELHDQRAAAADIVKLLSGSDAQPAGNTTNVTVNVGAVTADAAASRIAFLLSSATTRLLPEPKTIEGTASLNSELGTPPEAP